MRQQGIVVRLVRDRAFGFIRMSDGQEAFLHRTDCDESCPFEALSDGAQGTTLTFDLEKSDKGWRARNVSKATGNGSSSSS